LKFLYREKECIIGGEIDVLPLATHDGYWLLYQVMVVVSCVLLVDGNVGDE
jgi:hypothetical protein